MYDNWLFLTSFLLRKRGRRKGEWSSKTGFKWSTRFSPIELNALYWNRLTYQHIVVGVKVFSVWLSSAGDGSMIALYIEITPCIVWIQNKICIPESFKTNISQQLFFFYKITYVNSQRENTNSKGDFVLKNLF